MHPFQTLDRPIQKGDVVIRTKTGALKAPIDSIHLVTKTYHTGVGRIDSVGPGMTNFYAHAFEPLHTLPANKAKVGDTCICIDPCNPIYGQTVIVTNITSYEVCWDGGPGVGPCANSFDRFLLIPTVASLSQPSQPTKGPTLKLIDIISEIFSTTPTTDFEAKPSILAVIYTAKGDEVATFVADSTEEVAEKIANNSCLWGCRIVTYSVANVLETQIQIVITKAKS